MKKLLLAVIISVLAVTNISFGEYNHSNNGPQYGDVVESTSFDFKVEKKGSKLYATWNAYTGDDFKWYKVVTSKTNAKPSYPEDKTLKVLFAKENSSAVVYNPYTSYYRLCVVKQNNDRLCSNVVYLEKTENSHTNYKKKDKKNKYHAKKHNSSIDKKLDMLLMKFFKKVEDKYKNTTDRVKKLETTKKALQQLAEKNKKYAMLVEKINAKITKKIEEYDNGLEAIRNILDV